MSIAVMDRVWRCSKASQGKLLILLAIADFANDTGEAWPSIPTLAKKSRLKDRQAQYAIKGLIEMGELKISKNKGPHGCHLYHIMVSDKGAEIAPVQKVQGAVDGIRGAVDGTLGVHSTAPEPSLNRHKNRQVAHEPSHEIDTDPEITSNGKNSFDRFWEAYPRKVGKLKTREAFKKHKPPLERCLLAIEEQKQSDQWRKDDGQFIPHPATWLNHERWEDQPKAEVAPAPRRRSC